MDNELSFLTNIVNNILKSIAKGIYDLDGIHTKESKD